MILNYVDFLQQAEGNLEKKKTGKTEHSTPN